ncbi:MAG: WD40/YVTN/BNR-like repeat-containing protein [Thermoanaerobaculia bacterium]
MRRTVFIFVLMIAPLAMGQRRRAVVPVAFPPCSTIEGTPAVTFTRDEGRNLAPTALRLEGTGYTYGLAALDVPHTLLSFHRSTLSISNDDGCHWSALGDFTADFPPSITAAQGGRAYIWSDNRVFLMRYDSNGVVSLKAPGAIIGIAADAQDGKRVRAGFDDGGVAESTDAGTTWRGIGFPPSMSGINYRFAFDPASLDHVVAGTAVTGAFVSRNGGKTWTAATGFRSSQVNAFNFAISPVNGEIVWLMARDGESKHIFLSRDGGLTYVPVVDESAEVTIVNQPVMVAHPTNPDVMYFVFGTFFQGFGTNLYRYDAATSTLTATHNHYSDVNSIAFSREQPRVMYLGLETEDVR